MTNFYIFQEIKILITQPQIINLYTIIFGYVKTELVNRINQDRIWTLGGAQGGFSHIILLNKIFKISKNTLCIYNER